MIVIALTFRTGKSGISSGSFKIDMNYNEAEKREEGRRKKSRGRDSEEQPIQNGYGGEESE